MLASNRCVGRCGVHVSIQFATGRRLAEHLQRDPVARRQLGVRWSSRLPASRRARRSGGRRGLLESAGVYPIAAWKGPAGYVVSTDPDRLNLDFIHAFLPPRTGRVACRATPSSARSPTRCRSGFTRPRENRQASPARSPTTLPTLTSATCSSRLDHRGRGLAKFLVSCVLTHPQLQGLRRWALATADAHGLYRQFGFGPPAQPDIHMFIERSPAELRSSASDGQSPATGDTA